MLGQRMMMAASGRVATVTLTANAVDPANTSSYTFSAQSLGVAAGNRQIIVAPMTQGGIAGLTVSAVTIAGISATEIVEANRPATAESCSLWAADVPTGTTGDVVVTCTVSASGCGIGVYRLIGAQATASATATDTAGDPMSASLSIPANGVAIGVAGDSSGSTYVWTNLTERYEEIVDGNGLHTGASIDNGAAQTPTIICDPSNAAARQVFALASWGPA